ncbi:Hypothetical predicted protein [Olea europaea subsp. europaea]|uniref:DUF632 domain-containing protein n=1 Tax=Olea europaea subsp. europaea TaxID=158383 RepID=A0A8S0V640_OLEEU|nr:Hypothetical predicted protein [Olea europaea subsp. europaea]
MEVAKNQNIVQNNSKEAIVADCESKSETPGFTVYVNKRPTSMAEVIKDLEDQFMMVCKSAGEVSSMLEANRAQYLSTSNDLTAAKMINPMALFRSASSRSSSLRFLVKASSSRDEGYKLDRLYAWEKKLYQEVRAGERVRMAYEKKCKQLRNQDVKGEDPSSVDKTRTAIRDLQTQMNVSIHSVEAVSKRIETLRDEELQPQLLELVQGLSRMWHAMAEGHQLQKRTLDEAKILLAGMPSKLSGTKKYNVMSPSSPHRLAHSAANLEMELRNWRACFESWIVSQRSYVHALTSWLLRCVRSDADTSKLPFSPRRSSGAPPIFTICIQWSRFLDTVLEAPVLEGLDFFAAGVGPLYAQQLREDSRKNLGESKRFRGEPIGGMEMVEVGQFEDEFSVSSAEGYADLVLQWDNPKQPHSSNGTGKLCRLSRMWHAMAEGHQLQKRTLDEAKILLAGMPSKLSGTKKYTVMSPSSPHRLAHSAANLEMELRNWRACFESWIVSQRSYVHALTGWLLRCVRSDADTSKLPFSPRRSSGAPPIFTICIQWSRFLDTVLEAPVLEGLDFFAAGVGSLYAQ